MIKSRIFTLTAIIFLICFRFITVQGQTGSVAKTILFVGNSLTYANHLPGLVEELGKDRGMNIKSEMLAKPDYALEDHWNDRILQELITTNKYDYVVLQQGPSSQEDGRQMLLDYGARIKALCDSQHVRLAFFMVWPAYSNFQNFDGVIKNYTEAASKTNSLL